MNDQNKNTFNDQELIDPAMQVADGAGFNQKANAARETPEYKLADKSVNDVIKTIAALTDSYKKFSGDEIELREIEVLKIQTKAEWRDIQEEDIFAGRYEEIPVGFRCQPHNSGGFVYYCSDWKIEEMLKDSRLTQENRTLLKKLHAFWKKENCKVKTREAYPQEMEKALYTDDYAKKPIIAAPLYRLGGTYLDYDKLLSLGISGLRKEIQNSKEKTREGEKACRLYAAMEAALDLFSETCLCFAEKAKRKLRETGSAKRKKQLALMEKSLRTIAFQKPRTFHEATQLAFLYTFISGSSEYGRMDEYLGDFYACDIDNGIITEEETIQMLSCLWCLMDARNCRFDSRVIVGGINRRNPENADRLALVIMETTRRVKGIVPQLTLFCHNGMNDALFEKALDMIGEGNSYPMLYNDDVNIPAVQKAFGLSYEEAKDYLPFGCGEYVINHKSVGTPSGIINLLQALTVTLHKGINPVSLQPMGLPPETYGDFKTFDDLFNAYKRLVEYYVEQLALQEDLEYQIAGDTAPFLYLSMLYDDCIKRGKGILAGGVRYLGGTLESYGNTNTADSLTAIKELVYDKKVMSLEEMVKILDVDFEGYEKERKLMLDAPKYGNDNETADRMLVEVHKHICEVTRKQRENTGLHSYLVVVINNSANTCLGMQTGASPDGRNALTYMANANAPVPGCDQNGVTAFLNSIVKPPTDIHAGAIQGMKLSRDLFDNHRETVKILLKTYFENGGAQASINCLNREDLKNAMKEPEKYANLIVRVGGFCSKFVELPPEVQREILNRTLY